MGKRVLMVDMDQQGSLSSSFIKNINDLPCVITDALLDNQKPMKAVIQKTDYENIDLVPANLSGDWRMNSSRNGTHTTALPTSLPSSKANTT